jgi:hypothetical protein
MTGFVLIQAIGTAREVPVAMQQCARLGSNRQSGGHEPLNHPNMERRSE